MARFGKFKKRFKSFGSGIRRRANRFKSSFRHHSSRSHRPMRRRRSGRSGKLLGILPNHLRLGGIRIPMLLLAAVAAYFFVAPFKNFVNGIIKKK